MTFREVAYAHTRLGELSLRRRTELKLGVDVYEIKLNDEFLMSSLFTVAEVELARLSLAKLDENEIDVAIGGLGLGYTAKAALEHDNVRSLVVVEMLGDVIKWHRQKLLPLGETLSEDPRCRMVEGDFFAMVKDSGLDPEYPDRHFHAILLDIDHAPDFTLHTSHDDFYSIEGLRRLADHLHPGGIFALWSNDQPDSGFTKLLESVFADAYAHRVAFNNPLQQCESSNTVYVAHKTS
jgi:spermidine synthase